MCLTRVYCFSLLMNKKNFSFTPSYHKKKDYKKEKRGEILSEGNIWGAIY